MSRPSSPDSPARSVDARRVGGRGGGGAPGDFTYAVLAEVPLDPVPAGDRRRAPRQRTRLRSGKLVAVDGTFLVECLIYDLSARGCRVRLPSERAVPRTLQLFDDQSGLLHRCAVSWRDGSDAGLRFDPQARPDRAQADALRRKFYAVRT